VENNFGNNNVNEVLEMALATNFKANSSLLRRMKENIEKAAVGQMMNQFLGQICQTY